MDSSASATADTSREFSPRDAMLARYVLSSCVRPSVCLSVRPRVVHGLGWVGSGWVEIFSAFGGLGPL